MNKRDRHISFHMSEDEHREVMEKAVRAGMTMADFIRRAVDGQEIREAPPADVPALIREVRQVRSSMERLLKAAESGGMPEEASELRRALAENRALEKMIVGVYGC